MAKSQLNRAGLVAFRKHPDSEQPPTSDRQYTHLSARGACLLLVRKSSPAGGAATVAGHVGVVFGLQQVST